MNVDHMLRGSLYPRPFSFGACRCCRLTVTLEGATPEETDHAEQTTGPLNIELTFCRDSIILSQNILQACSREACTFFLIYNYSNTIV